MSTNGSYRKRGGRLRWNKTTRTYDEKSMVYLLKFADFKDNPANRQRILNTGVLMTQSAPGLRSPQNPHFNKKGRK